ncbi:MAG: right-handed parallel beta-helix repeat-containing protein, partial [Nanoarchaeota archaeon]
DINETIVVPKGFSLEIEAGSTLRFSKGKSLVSYSAVTAKGTEEDPITFTGKDDAKWGSVGIVGIGKSIFEHVRFENGNGAMVNNQEFLGSLSLVESDIEISNSEFSNSSGKDGLWALNSDVMIRNNIFKDILADCLDLDNGSGEVSGNQFINCGDEGIDLSRNEDIEVFGNVIINSGNGISADANLEEIRKLNEIKS